MSCLSLTINGKGILHCHLAELKHKKRRGEIGGPGGSAAVWRGRGRARNSRCRNFPRFFQQRPPRCLEGSLVPSPRFGALQTGFPPVLAKLGDQEEKKITPLQTFPAVGGFPCSFSRSPAGRRERRAPGGNWKASLREEPVSIGNK